MATATITPDQDTVLAEIFIAAPPERVFEAITDPSQLAKWWGASGLYRLTETAADLRPDCSPRRKPWVSRRKSSKAPSGA